MEKHSCQGRKKKVAMLPLLRHFLDAPSTGAWSHPEESATSLPREYHVWVTVFSNLTEQHFFNTETYKKEPQWAPQTEDVLSPPLYHLSSYTFSDGLSGLSTWHTCEDRISAKEWPSSNSMAHCGHVFWYSGLANDIGRSRALWVVPSLGRGVWAV